MVFKSGMASLFDVACRQLSGLVATTASAHEYSVPAVSAHTKYEAIAKTAAMSTDRACQIAQDR